MIFVFILFIFLSFFLVFFDHRSIPETKDEVPNYFVSAVADQPSREAMADKSAKPKGPTDWKA
jgi:hypothetical protein